MEVTTTLTFTMPTDVDYTIMEFIAKHYYDSEEHWPVEQYDAEKRMICIEEVWATKDDAVEFAKLLESIISEVAGDPSDEAHDPIANCSYTMHGHTDHGGYAEYEYIINRSGDKLTMKESCFSHEDFNYDDCEDDDDCDEIDEKRMEAYEAWLDDPDYELEVDLNNGRYIKDHEVITVDDDMIIEYLKANHLPYDQATIDSLSFEDIYAIMDGTFGKDDNQ